MKAWLLIVVLTIGVYAQSRPGVKRRVSERPPAVPTSSPTRRASSAMTLGETRTQLIGKKIVIINSDSEYSLDRYGNLVLWRLAVATSGGYERDFFHGLPKFYVQQQAEVVAVQAAETTGGVNALGERVDDASLVNPVCYVVVKFPDGTLASVVSSPSIIFGGIDIARPFRQVQESIERGSLITKQLPNVIGRTVYPVAYSVLFVPSASIEELLQKRATKRVFDVPRLRPLTIKAAKYDNEHGVVVVKFIGQEGQEYLGLAPFNLDLKGSFIRQLLLGPGLIDNLSDLTKREILAIEKGELFVGMSRVAMAFTVGLPQKENDWGRGGRQLVYSDGALFVYLNSSGRVTNWQFLDK